MCESDYIFKSEGNKIKETVFLADTYFFGRTVEVDYSMAFQLYLYAINDNIENFYSIFYTIEDRLNYIEYQKAYTSVLSDDIANPNDLIREQKMYAKIANHMGWMYFTGNGSEKDTEKGMELLELASIYI